MYYLKALFFVSILWSLNGHANDFPSRVKEAYKKADNNFDIDCYYSNNKKFKLITPKEKTKKEADTISRMFSIETENRNILMLFTLTRVGKELEYNVILDDTHFSVGKVSRREFYIAPIQNKDFALEFETNQIYCNVNFAYAEPFALLDGDYHINVHPHTIYDWQKRLKTQTEAYLNNDKYRSIILLETGNYRGNLVNIHHFLDDLKYSLPENEYLSDLEDIPATVPLVVSPAGNNRFDFKAEKEINITFTGGNHNYCIWNGTRHVLIGLMQSKSEAKVNFYYATDAIVAQPKGIEGLGMNFSRKNVNRSNLLKDLLSDANVQKSYHLAYLNYFQNNLARKYSAMYRSYSITYKAPGFETKVTLKGEGSRDLEVSLNYL